MKSKLRLLLFIFLQGSFITAGAQEIWDDDSLSRQKVYYSLTEALQYPDSVYRLNLSKKKLREFPYEIFKLRNLRELNLNKNNLARLPEDIGNLVLLQKLSASNNRLKAIPPAIGKLTNLKYIEFNRNIIEELPVEIGRLVNLEELYLWDNELGVIPDEIKNCGSLRVLELRGILFNEESQGRIHELLPYTKVYFSPPCNCKN